MSRGSPRHSFSPVRPMNQSLNNDRRRASNPVSHPYDRPFIPSEANRTEPQTFRPAREDINRVVSSRPRSPMDSHGGRIPGLYNASYETDRSYRPVTPFQDRPVNPGPLDSFRDRAGTPGPAQPFPERTAPSTIPSVGRPGNDHWSPGTSQTTGKLTSRDERMPGNDHWSPGAPRPTASSSSWEPRGQRTELQGWASKIKVPNYNSLRTPVDTFQGPLFQPSHAWKRAREERDRQLSIEFRTIIPADHRSAPSDGITSEGGRDGAPIAGTANATQDPNDTPDFQARRFRQQPPPPPLPPRFDQRNRYSDRYTAPAPNFRHTQMDTFRPRGPGSFTAQRRPQHRISARISARPKRSPSPSSSGSSSSSSRVRKPGHRSSRSLSRSGRSRSRVSSLEREIHYDSGRRLSSPRRQSSERRPSASSPTQFSRGRSSLAPNSFKAPPPSASDSIAVPSAPSGKFTFRSPEIVKSTHLKVPARGSPSASSRSSESSIRSSVHSSPALVATEISPTPHADITASVAQSSSTELRVSNSQTSPSHLPPQDDAEFELPGMRFQKDGALKPGFSPPSIKSVLDIQGGIKGEEQLQHDMSNSLGTLVYSPVEVDNEATRYPTQSPERAIARAARDVTPVDNAEPSSLPSHRVAIEVAPATRSSPTPHISQSKAPPQASAHRPLGSSHILSRQKDVQPVQMLDVIADTERPDPPHIETPGQVNVGPIAPDSSPLSEPMPLSPPPDIPGLQEDMEDDSSSMDIDDESASEQGDDIAAALRVFVKAREGKDLQTRHERYEPILRTNHSFLDLSCSRINTSNEEVVREVMRGSFRVRLEAHSAVSESLLERFTRHAEDLAARTSRLRAEYKSYHDRWVANCRKLDQSMASSASQGVEGLPVPSGRVTRRSTTFGDAVRSDLEMEQIIASLGNEDMTDPNVLAIRNTAVIPDLISTNPFTIDYSYNDNNGFVDDPEEVFDVYDTLGRWTDEEKEIFVQKYGVHPKQFGIIASFLPEKTPAQCVMFYYLHKKELIDFRGVIAKYGPKRKRGRKPGKGKGNALLADIMKPPRVGADDEGTTHKHSARFRTDLAGVRFPTRRPIATAQENAGESSRVLSNSATAKGSRVVTLQQEDPASDVDYVHSSKRRPSPRVSGRGGRASPSEDEEETGTVVVDYADDPRKRQARFGYLKDLASEQDIAHVPVKKPKLPEKVKRPPGRPPKNKNKFKAIDKDGGSSSGTAQKTATSYVWSKGEEASYLELVARHGKDFEKIAADMPAKTAIQCRNYFRNNAKDLNLERIASEAPALKSSVGVAPKDKGTSKTTKSKDVANGEGDIGASGSSRVNRSRQIIASAGFKGKEKLASPSDPISASLNAMFTPPASTASSGSASTKDGPLSKRLPNFIKSKRQETRPRD